MRAGRSRASTDRGRRSNALSRLSVGISLGLLLLIGLSAQTPDEPGNAMLRLVPEQFEIGLFYGGETLRIEGSVEPGSGVVVVVRGPEDEEVFNKKVRAGPIWISSGKVSVSGVPSLFLSLSSGPIRSLVDADVVNSRVLDAEAIKHHMLIDAGGDTVDEELIAENYLSLKVEQGKYQVFEGAIELGEPAGSLAPYSIEIDWPRTAQPAVYEVTAYELSDGAVTRTSEAELSVVKVGMSESIHAFALDSAVQYGLLAVLLAVIAGFGIDFLASRIFGSRPGRAAH